MELRVLVLSALAVAVGAARADEPCPLETGAEQVVAVALTAPDPVGVLVAGVTLVVDHPETKLGIAGEGIAVTKAALSDAPPDAVASANDLGDAVRVVIARPGPLPVGRPLLRLHFQRCRGAEPATTSELACRVVDAADPSANKLRDVLGCTATIR